MKSVRLLENNALLVKLNNKYLTGKITRTSVKVHKTMKIYFCFRSTTAIFKQGTSIKHTNTLRRPLRNILITKLSYNHTVYPDEIK